MEDSEREGEARHLPHEQWRSSMRDGACASEGVGEALRWPAREGKRGGVCDVAFA